MAENLLDAGVIDPAKVRGARCLWSWGKYVIAFVLQTRHTERLVQRCADCMKG